MTVLDSNIKALMNQTVTWEAFSGVNKYGDSTFASGVSKTCFVDERGYGGSGGVMRSQKADQTIMEPMVELYFDANDADVQTFKINDRFTITNVEGQMTFRSQADGVYKFVGPDGSLWVFVVAL